MNSPPLRLRRTCPPPYVFTFSYPSPVPTFAFSSLPSELILQIASHLQRSQSLRTLSNLSQGNLYLSSLLESHIFSSAVCARIPFFGRHVSALQWAAYHGHARLVKYLLDHGLDMLERTFRLHLTRWDRHAKFGWATIHPYSAVDLAVFNGHVDVLRLFHSHDPAAFISTKDASDEDFVSPLGIAVFREQLAAAEFLVDAGADVNELCCFQDKTYSPLMLAVERGWADMVGLMLRHGGDAKTRLGSTAEDIPAVNGVKMWTGEMGLLDLANVLGHKDVEKELKRHGASSTAGLWKRLQWLAVKRGSAKRGSGRVQSA